MLIQKTAVQTLSHSKTKKLIIGLFFLNSLSACVTAIPVDEYNIARAAYYAAKQSEAARYAPGVWYQAEDAYRKGEKAFKERDYSVAKQQFDRAKLYSEQAENVARLARFQNGDSAP